MGFFNRPCASTKGGVGPGPAMRAAGKHASLVRLVLSPLARFIKFYVIRLGFLDGQAGLVHIAIGCMNSFNKYAKLLALQRTRT